MTIHLIAAGKLQNPKNWPKTWHRCYDIWKSSPYKIKLWGDKDIDNLLLEDDEDFFKDYLSKLDPIYKWDYVRYVILGKLGGAYFDLDVEIKINFIPLLNPETIYISEGEDNCLVSNHIIISPPNYQYWYNIRQEAKYRLIKRFKKAKENGYWTIETVGPIGLSYILADKRYRYTPLSKWHFGSVDTDLQFCIHHTTHKWSDEIVAPFKIYDNV
jgi:mannosyltransferase OCH1-like enzyme